jgi:hypothetical protein
MRCYKYCSGNLFAAENFQEIDLKLLIPFNNFGFTFIRDF